MRISPINTTNQNNKKQSFTAIKTDVETFARLKKVARQLNVDFYSISDLAADHKITSIAKKHYEMGKHLDDEGKAYFGGVKDVYVTGAEAFQVQSEFFVKYVPIAKQLKELIEKAKIVTSKEADDYVSVVLPKIIDAKKNTNTILGYDVFKID